MQTRKIITQSTDGKYVGQEVIVQDGVASVSSFSFNVIQEDSNRIIGANYSVTFQQVEN